MAETEYEKRKPTTDVSQFVVINGQTLSTWLGQAVATYLNSRANNELLQSMQMYTYAFLELDAYAVNAMNLFRNTYPTCVCPNVRRVVLLKGQRFYEEKDIVSIKRLLGELLPHVEEVIVQSQLGNFTAWCGIWPRLQRIYVQERTVHFENRLMDAVANVPFVRSLSFSNLEEMRDDDVETMTSTRSPPLISHKAAQAAITRAERFSTHSNCQHLCITLPGIDHSNLDKRVDVTLAFWKQLIAAYGTSPHLIRLDLNIGYRLMTSFRHTCDRPTLHARLLKQIRDIPHFNVLRSIVLHPYNETTVVRLPTAQQQVVLPCACGWKPDFCACSVPKPTIVLWDHRHARSGHKWLDDSCLCNVCKPMWSGECTPLLTVLVPTWMRSNVRHAFRDSIAALIVTIANLIGSQTAQEAMLSCTNLHPTHLHDATTCGKDAIWNKTLATLPQLASRWLSSRFVASYSAL